MEATANSSDIVEIDACPGISPRLWLYTNFDCNLQCTYCCVESGPRVERRGLPLPVFRRLVDEAAAAGITEVFLTGGEPFLLPDIEERISYASDRIQTTVLTNASLLTGKRRSALQSLAGSHVRFQVSLDGADSDTHDSFRGHGSWRTAVEGIGTLKSLGFTVVVATTETPVNAPHIAALREFVATLGISPEHHFVRPLARRGSSSEGLTLTPADLEPEMSVSVDGVFWHPLACADDMLVTRRLFPLREAMNLVHEQYHTVLAEGCLPNRFR